MFSRLAIIALSGLLSCGAMPATGRAEAPPSPALDPLRVPHISAAGRADYADFLLRHTPRVFAISPDGAWGWASAVEGSAERTEAAALAACQRSTQQACRVYARDLTVADGTGTSASFVARVPVPGTALASLSPDNRFVWHGAKHARGAYLWAHGRSGAEIDGRGIQPQPHVRAFNNAGYDIIRLDRHPRYDTTEAGARWLREGAAEIRERGYARVVVGGQSRGAWNALQALSEPGLVDAVVAIAPAAHGPTGSQAHAWALQDLQEIASNARSPGTRVIIANFAGDPFDPNPVGRAEIFRSFANRVGGLVFFDRPRDIEGHGGGEDWRFTSRYATCMLAFVERLTDRCEK